MHRWKAYIYLTGYSSVVDNTDLSSFISFTRVVGSQICEITHKIPRTFGCSSKSFKVVDFDANRKHICNFLIVNNLIWTYLLPFSRYWCIKIENGWFFSCTLMCFTPPLREPFRISGWNLPPTKTRGMGLPYGENCIILTSNRFWQTDPPMWRTETDGRAILDNV